MKAILYSGLSVVFLSALVASQGCSIVDGPCEKGKGGTTRRELEIESFTGINMTMAGAVTIEKGEELKVEIEGQSNILDLISNNVENDRWTIYPRSCVSDDKEFAVYVTLPALDDITLTGSGTVLTLDTFEDDIDIMLSGSGQITYAGEAENANIALSGSGKISFNGTYTKAVVSNTGSGSLTLSGTTDFLKVTCSGSGGVDTYEFVALKAQVVNSGSGSSKVYVTEELEAVVTGSGSIFYKGNPTLSPEPIETGSGKVVNSN